MCMCWPELLDELPKTMSKKQHMNSSRGGGHQNRAQTDPCSSPLLPAKSTSGGQRAVISNGTSRNNKRGHDQLRYRYL